MSGVVSQRTSQPNGDHLDWKDCPLTISHPAMTRRSSYEFNFNSQGTS